MRKFLFLLFLIFSTASTACLNYFYGVDKEGHLHPTDDVYTKFNMNFGQRAIERKLIKLEEQLNKDHSYMTLSDYAVNLMKIGKPKQAQRILAELNKHYPNEYKIATNLGTAYELNGELDSAIRYIKRGMQLNPDSHEGSEWVHLKVLQTKFKLKKDPNYLDNHTVLELSKAQEKDSLVRYQIMIQARERFPFTPGPDKIMASIIVDLADCYASTYSIEYAKALYTLAKEYYGDNSKMVDAKIKEMIALRGKYEAVQPDNSRKLTNGREGTHSKIIGIRYKNLMQDNNQPPYTVKWEKINLNVDSLLALSGLTIEPEVLTKEEPVKKNVTKKTPVKEKNKSNSFLLSMMALASTIIIAFSAYRRFKKRKS
jgi:tetratricopeptide (TPR) repeat protein